MTGQDEMLRDLVWLTMVFGAGNRAISDLLERYPSPHEAYEALRSGAVPNLMPRYAEAVRNTKIDKADRVIDYCRSNGIALLTQDSPDYPLALLCIDRPPVLLTAKGNLRLCNHLLAITVVGARHATPYAEQITDTIATFLAQNSMMIVSGFAKGIDRCAHEAALRAGGTTLAVLGCGVNVNYPADSQPLRERMLSSGQGLLLSEFLPGTQPYPANFPCRNRILCGLSPMTAVMEASARSGSLVTADLAVQQDRAVLCVPPPDIFDPRYAGTAALLRDGAVPLMSIGDVLAEYRSLFSEYETKLHIAAKQHARIIARCIPEPVSITEEDFEEPLPAPPKASRTARPRRVQPQREPEIEPETGLPAEAFSYPQRTDLPEDADFAEIVRYLREHGATDVDVLADQLHMEMSDLLNSLTLLELDNYITSLFGRQFRAAE